jgi:hypothetical protein
LERISIANSQRLPNRVFEGKFPETVGGVLNAMAYKLGRTRSSRPDLQISNTKVILAHYLVAPTPEHPQVTSDDLDPTQPLTGSLVSYITALAYGRELRRLNTQTGGTSTSPVVGENKKFSTTRVACARMALDAYQLAMPDTPVVRVDHIDRKREELRAAVLNAEAAEQQLPLQVSVHDFLSFSRDHLRNTALADTPEDTRRTHLQRVQAFIAGVTDLPPEIADLTGVRFSDLEPIARQNGVATSAITAARTTFKAWEAFLDSGQSPTLASDDLLVWGLGP